MDVVSIKKIASRKLISSANSFDCYLLPGQLERCSEGYLSIYNKAYCFWRNMVIEGLVSENLTDAAKSLYSDEYVYQDEAVCLFNADKPIGLFMFSWMDLESRTIQDLKYFKLYYPASVIRSILEQQYYYIMTMSQLMVAPGWRQYDIGAGLSDILVDFAIMRFLESEASLLLTFTRNNRKTNDLGYRHGAKPLLKNHVTYGIDTDILGVFRDAASLTNICGIATISRALWRNKICTVKTNR